MRASHAERQILEEGRQLGRHACHFVAIEHPVDIFFPALLHNHHPVAQFLREKL